MVALTTLCEFVLPSDFANTSVTPALSRTARIAPPAITPVPIGADLKYTLAEQNLEKILKEVENEIKEKEPVENSCFDSLLNTG